MPEPGGNFTANALSNIARPPLVLSRGTRPWDLAAQRRDLLAGQLCRDGRDSQCGSSAAGSRSSRRAHSRSSS